MQARETGSLRIGAVRPLDAMEICARLLKQYPNLRLAVQAGLRRRSPQWPAQFRFRRRRYRSTRRTIRGFFSSFYKRYRINIIAHVDHPLARRRAIRIKDLEEQRVIQRTGGAFDRALKDAGVNIQPILETSSLEGVVAAVMQGIGVGAISDSGLAGIKGDPNLKVIPVSDLDMFTEAHVVCLAERREPAVDRELPASRQCGDAQPSQGAGAEPSVARRNASTAPCARISCTSFLCSGVTVVTMLMAFLRVPAAST